MKTRLLLFSIVSMLLVSMFTVALHVNPIASSPISKAEYEEALIKAADRIVSLQSATDYGWDWDITGLTSHSPNPSASNIYGVTALVLLDAYQVTGDTAYFDAAEAVADYLVSLGSDRYHYQFDLEFLIEFAEISGDPTYYTFASDVWTWIKANKPEFADGVTLYNWYYTTRYPGSHGGTIWGTGDWAIAALKLGDTAWATDMANVIADNYTKIELGTDPYGFEYVGWGKALKTFQAVDPIAYADEIADIVSILMPLQQADGSFTGWVQDEAYVIMGLFAVGELEMAERAADWLVENQGYDTILGGWKLPDGKEYSEVTSEAGQAIYLAMQIVHDIAVTQLTATPLMVEIGEKVYISVTVKNLGDTNETFTLIVNYGPYAQVETITDLQPEGEVTFNYEWDTTGAASCFHAISALAGPVPKETSIRDNYKEIFVRLVSYIPEPAIVAVEPDYKKGITGGYLEVNVSISELDAYWDFCAFDITLYYNTTMMDVVSITLGEFAIRFNLTFQIIKEINEAEGYIRLAYTWDFISIPPQMRPTPYGQGTLFTVRFALKEIGVCVLELGSVNLVAFGNATKWCTPLPESINVNVQDGSVEIVPRHFADLNADGKINIQDVVIICAAYDSTPSDPNWNPWADLAPPYGIINIYDVVTLCVYYDLVYDP